MVFLLSIAADSCYYIVNVKENKCFLMRKGMQDFKEKNTCSHEITENRELNLLYIVKIDQ